MIIIKTLKTLVVGNETLCPPNNKGVEAVHASFRGK